MRNPFEGTIPPVDSPERLHGRAEAASALDRMIAERRNAVIMGVEGVGKSSLLETYFSYDYRLKKARDEKKLFDFSPFPLFMTGSEIFAYLADRVLVAASMLKRCGQGDVYDEIRSEASRIRNESMSMASALRSIIEMLHNVFGYSMTLVIDDFEQFTSSESVKEEHHGLLRSLIRQLQFVVATNYDFSKVSTTAIGVGSLFLQTFSGNEIRLGGLAEADAAQYLQSATADLPVQFTDDEIGHIMFISGRIPALMRTTARIAYEQKSLSGGIDYELLPREACAASGEQMKKWCRLIDNNQIYTLERTTRRDPRYPVTDTAILSSTQASLFKRGLLEEDPEEKGQYECNSLLFWQFCTEKGNLIAEKEPPKADAAFAQALDEFIWLYREQGAARAVEKTPKITNENYEQFLDELPSLIGPQSAIAQKEYTALNLDSQKLSGFSNQVREMIDNGIRISRVVRLLGVGGSPVRLEGDYSSYLFSFFKAYECHMRENFTPLVLHFDSAALRKMLKMDEHRPIYSKAITLKNIEDFIICESERLSALAQLTGRHSLDSKWWEGFASRLKPLRAIRNKCTHEDIKISHDEAVGVIDMLFSKEMMMQIGNGALLAEALGA